ncbi:MerR family transcriptional regulator [Actinokineospora cianjurensis]|uniref:DNA-binding transcriptional MerR regulator n=1 Tax=Actinokineospora cianjurensis TaxID=585224 RepID=A0A421B0W3_9PSEU|nr:MerR family transcriptional regulator [Actinokineospora cianjurensis]RLK58035.1 DNA-binding transcriptional MerR regulator [Actinokineospora cianjurensis]
MRIGDAATAAGTTPRAMRLYEERGLLPPPDRSHTGQRRYTYRDVERVRIIRQLLGLGLTIEDIRASADRLHLIEGDTLPEYASAVCTQTTGTVHRRLAAMDAEIARLTDRRDRLAARTSVRNP